MQFAEELDIYLSYVEAVTETLGDTLPTGAAATLIAEVGGKTHAIRAKLEKTDEFKQVWPDAPKGGA